MVASSVDTNRRESERVKALSQIQTEGRVLKTVQSIRLDFDPSMGAEVPDTNLLKSMLS